MKGKPIRFVSILMLILLGQQVWAKEYHVASYGSDQNAGTRGKPFKTISYASNIAIAGDIITVHAGVYRELVAPVTGGTSDHNRIIYRAAKGEKVEIKGSEIVKGWKMTGSGIWQLRLSDSYFGKYNPYKDEVYGDWFFPGKRKLHTGEIYLNGKALYETSSLDALQAGTAEAAPVGIAAGSALSPDYTWICTTNKDETIITANFHDLDPNKELVEMNVRPSCFYPAKTGVNYITVSGFHMSQAATQWAAPTAEQVGLIGTNWSKGWVIENNIISDSKCVGITLGKDRASGQNVWSADKQKDGSIHYNEMIVKVIATGWNKENIGSHLVKGNTIFNCGAAGICGSFGAAYSTIANNNIYDIFTRRPFWGAEMGGIKIHGAIDVLIKGNQIRNTNIGIWLDWMAQGTRVTANLCQKNDYVDFFSEVNHGPYLVDNNLFLSAFSLKDWAEGGAYAHNLFSGLISRAPQSRETPYFASHSTAVISVKPIRGGDTRFYNNIFVGKNGATFQKPTGIYMPDDAVDSLSGYGLKVYDSAESVYAAGNIFLNGALPSAGESGAAETSSLVNTALLGKTAVSKQCFENPDGSPITILNDYYGKPRNHKRPMPGPFQLAAEQQLIRSELMATNQIIKLNK